MYERLCITRYKCCKNAKFSYFYSYLLNSEFLLNQGACFYRILNWTLVYMHIAKMYFCQYLFLSKSLFGSRYLLILTGSRLSSRLRLPQKKIGPRLLGDIFWISLTSSGSEPSKKTRLSDSRLLGAVFRGFYHLWLRLPLIAPLLKTAPRILKAGLFRGIQSRSQ